jgi:hypothetical protein
MTTKRKTISKESAVKMLEITQKDMDEAVNEGRRLATAFSLLGPPNVFNAIDNLQKKVLQASNDLSSVIWRLGGERK